MAAEAPVRAVARVDLGAIERDCRGLRRSLAAGSQLCAVVKSDAYGHGAVPAARAALAGGATTLGVATAAEAAELRDHLPDARILTMGALSAPELERALRAGSEIAAWRRDTAAAAGELGAALGFRPRVHVKYDTGMGRLGRPTRRPSSTSCARSPPTRGWSSPGSGPIRDRRRARGPRQRALRRALVRFRELADRVREQAPGVLLHAANSAATLRDKAAHFGMVRCGIAIYGPDPSRRPLGPGPRARAGAPITIAAKPTRVRASTTAPSRITARRSASTRNICAAYNNRGAVYFYKGDTDRAIKEYDEAIRLGPKNPAAYNNRGSAYSEKSDYDRAIKDFDAAIRLDPKYVAAYYNRGNAHKGKGEYDRAIKDYSEAIRLDPKYTWAYSVRGDAWRGKNDFERAAKDYGKAIDSPASRRRRTGPGGTVAA